MAQYTADIARGFVKNRGMVIENQLFHDLYQQHSAEQLAAVVKKMREDNQHSPRFFLMRFVAEQLAEEQLEQGFKLGYGCREFVFAPVDMQAAKNAPAAELEKYIELLAMIAADNMGADLELWQQRFGAVMRDNCWPLGKKKNRRLRHEDCFAIALALRFDWMLFDEFLCRVGEEDGVDLCSSRDLIELYCILVQADEKNAQSLMQQYAERAADIAKNSRAERPEHFTADMNFEFEDIVESFGSGSKADAEFVNWLVGKAADLDVPGQTALRIYKNLIHYYYECKFGGEAKLPADDVQLFLALEELCGDDVAHEVSTDSKSVLLLLDWYAQGEANAQSWQNGILKAVAAEWQYPALDAENELVLRPLAYRLRAILKGEIGVKKNDILFMFWAVCSYCWSQGTSDRGRFPERYAMFMETATLILSRAYLPEFYPPHLMEYTMLMAISGGDYAWDVYQSLWTDLYTEYIGPLEYESAQVAAKPMPATAAENNEVAAALADGVMLYPNPFAGWEQPIVMPVLPKLSREANRTQRERLERTIRKVEVDLGGLTKEILQKLLPVAEPKGTLMFTDQGLLYMPNATDKTQTVAESYAARDKWITELAAQNGLTDKVLQKAAELDYDSSYWLPQDIVLRTLEYQLETLAKAGGTKLELTVNTKKQWMLTVSAIEK